MMRAVRCSIAALPIVAAAALAPAVASALAFAITRSETSPCFVGMLCLDVEASLTGTTGFGSVSYPLPLPAVDPGLWIPVVASTRFVGAIDIAGEYPADLVRSRQALPDGALMGAFTETAELLDAQQQRLSAHEASDVNQCAPVLPAYTAPTVTCSSGNGAFSTRELDPDHLDWTQDAVGLRFTFDGGAPLPIAGTAGFDVHQSDFLVSVVYHPRPEPALLSLSVVDSGVSTCGDGLLCARTTAVLAGTAAFGSQAFSIPLPIPDPTQWMPIDASILFAGGMGIGSAYLTADVRERQGTSDPPVVMGDFAEDVVFSDDGGGELARSGASQAMLCGRVPDGYTAPTIACGDGNFGLGSRSFGPGELAWTQHPVGLVAAFSSSDPLPILGTERFLLHDQTIEISVTYSADDDHDGLANALDNCPTVANPGQLDRGGVGSNTPDGIGDACQCGDVNASGTVTAADAALIQRAVLRPPMATLPKPELCDVGGSHACTAADAAIVARALLAPPRATIGNACGAVAP